ncbi:MAG: sigma-70 family RNA polymerase sigma factor [Bacteroidetes bacterium]|nr:sigma-70 family RNA polymerase sigma factor [Bacteroidota bacterium]PHX83343.1 MAG: RNA polymerase subunit sigma-24 [Flavobacteriales bacterium]
MRNAELQDQELVSLYIQGNESCLEDLITRHKKRVFSYIMMIVRDRHLAEDVFQDTFIKVIQTLKRGTYNDEGKFLPWVLRIAHNLIIDHFRRVKRMPVVNGGDDFDIFSILTLSQTNAEDKLTKRQIRSDVRKAIENLPIEQREVLIMRYYIDMSFKEIADTTNCSINTALGRMRYALINLKKMLEKQDIALSA